MIIKFLKNLIKMFKGEDFSMQGTYIFRFTNMETGNVREVIQENMIPLTGRAYIILRLMQDQATPGIKLTHTALGSGTNAPANGDTQLQTETYRKAVASATSAGNIGYVSAFYTAVEFVGTIREVGLFINGTGAANSGTLFSRVATNLTKSNIETLTVDYQLTLN